MKITLFVSIFLLFTFACSVQQSVPLSDESKQQISMLPADAQVVGYVNVHQILNSPVYKLLNEETGADPFANDSYQEFIEKTGFDLHEHMQEMLFAGKLSNAHNSRGMFVAFGNFNAQKIIDYIKTKDKEKKLQETKYGEFTILKFDDDGFTMCFADSAHFIAGEQQLVQNWLDLLSGKKEPAEMDEQLLKRIEGLYNRKSMWMIMDAGTLVESVEKEGISLAKGLKNIYQADFSMTMDESLNVLSRIICADEEKAELVQDAIRGFISSAKLTVSDDRDAVDILNKIEISSDDNAVTGKMKLNQEELKKLLQKRDMLHKVDIV
jgi:hypothetical protein